MQNNNDMNTNLKERIDEKVDIEKFNFTWETDLDTEVQGLISIAKC